jgi:ABC-type Mn2+/Zn2+ transport system ATPase subunit
MTTPTLALNVQNLVVELDKHRIIDGISFQVPIGSVTAIIGPNGAGKSVLIKCILNLLPKQSGTVEIMDTNHDQYHKIAPLVSYIPQYINIDRQFPLTVAGLFSLKSPRPLGLSPIEKRHMNDLLAKTNTRHLINSRLSVLSGGQLQRIILAYSLMDHPKILLLDEPAAGIDAEGQDTIYTLLSRIQHEEKLTMVLISHELQIVMNYADQVLCLNRRLLCAGAPRKVLTNETLQHMYGTEVGHFLHDHH